MHCSVITLHHRSTYGSFIVNPYETIIIQDIPNRYNRLKSKTRAFDYSLDSPELFEAFEADPEADQDPPEA